MPNERRTRIRDYIDARGEATVAALLELCGNCSSMTLWRDLNALEKDGYIRRTRGGAISMRSIQPDVEGLYNQRAQENTEEKRRIARAALSYVKPGLSVYMDAGSSIMCLAKMLNDQHYTIVTSGANIAIELSQRRSCNVILVGGQISGSTLSCSGAQAESFLDQINIGTAIMGASGYSAANGFTSGNFSERELKCKVIKKAQEVVMLMDHSKHGRSLPYTFATFEDVDVFVTDETPDEATVRACKEHGVKLLIAKD